jgi:protein ImuB
VIVQAPAEIPQALATLPPAVLNIDARTVALLGRLGVRDLRTCWQLPRAALTRRFGKRLREELDWALGLHPEVRIVFESPPRFDRQCELIAETDNTQALQFVARRLILELAGFLRARHAGTHVLQWTLCHADKKRTGLQLGLVSPSCDPERFSSLLRERLERLRLRMPVRALRLQVDDVVPLLAKTDDLFASGTAELQENSDRLLERLRARLGMNAVQGLSLVPEHRPEYAWRYCEPGQGKAEMQMPPRPLWLLAEPVPLRIGKVTWQRDVSLLAGERIQSGWWDGRQIVRDYFVLHDRQGLRLWVFREPGNADTWYVHGVFA